MNYLLLSLLSLLFFGYLLENNYINYHRTALLSTISDRINTQSNGYRILKYQTNNDDTFNCFIIQQYIDHTSKPFYLHWNNIHFPIGSERNYKTLENVYQKCRWEFSNKSYYQIIQKARPNIILASHPYDQLYLNKSELRSYLLEHNHFDCQTLPLVSDYFSLRIPRKSPVLYLYGKSINNQTFSVEAISEDLDSIISYAIPYQYLLRIMLYALVIVLALFHFR